MARTETPLELLQTHPTASVAETAEMLRCSTGQVYVMAQDGRLESVRVGKRVVIKTDSIRRYLGQ